MPEPVNPSDHSIGVGNDSYELDERFSYVEWRMGALAEAIHQTFERDAEWVQAKEAHAEVVAVYETCPAEEQNGQYGWSKAHDSFEEGFMDRPGAFNTARPTDPATEIDRQARLIVDAEYRRRAREATDA